MPKVFISYRHLKPDEELATECARFLEGHGLDVFMDTRIRIGQEWVEEIDRQLRSSQYLIVLLSAQSIRSDMVRREIALAHKLRKNEQLIIFPVRVAFEGELPYDLGAYLDPIQYKIWNQNQPLSPICEAILQEIKQPTHDTELARVCETSSKGLQLLAEATQLCGAPLPAADPRLETGAIGPDSPFYVRRSTDDRVARLILQKGVTVLVKGLRQVGKTSLMARAQALARENGQRTLYLDFQFVDETHFESLQSLPLYLARRVAREIRTRIKPDDMWNDLLGAPESLTGFLEEAVLQKAETRLSITLDEVDRLFRYEYRNGFLHSFGLGIISVPLIHCGTTSIF
jgi:AAA-like domain/TIR domain